MGSLLRVIVYYWTDRLLIPSLGRGAVACEVVRRGLCAITNLSLPLPGEGIAQAPAPKS